MSPLTKALYANSGGNNVFFVEEKVLCDVNVVRLFLVAPVTVTTLDV